MASNAAIPGTNSPVQQVQLLDSAGAALGTAASPLTTATSSLQTTADLTNTVLQITTATTTVASTATASVRTRVYRMRLNTAAANKITILRGATVLEVLNFTGAGFQVYDFATRPWYATNANEALNITTSTAVEVNVILELTKVA